jgi:hypothetical protein
MFVASAVKPIPPAYPGSDRLPVDVEQVG